MGLGVGMRCPVSNQLLECRETVSGCSLSKSGCKYDDSNDAHTTMMRTVTIGLLVGTIKHLCLPLLVCSSRRG